jgi:DNA mismatch repair protein MutS
VKIKTTLNQDAPVAIAKGNAIAKGEWVGCYAISTSGKEFLKELKNESHNWRYFFLKIS